MAYDANFSESATFNATFAGNAIDAVSNEVIDIRTAYDGTVYPSAGDAVRSQIEEAMESSGSSVPTNVRQAMLTLFESAAYAETGLTDEIAVVQSWASEVTEISLSASTLTLNGDTPQTIVATVVPSSASVTWSSSDTSIATVVGGVVTGVSNGTCRITASAGDKSATCAVTVTGFAVLESISAVYTQSGTVYDTDSLDDLKADLVVTATYSDSTTETITNYVLSGTLAEGTSTITVTYQGKFTTFNVTVTAKPYQYVEYVESDGACYIVTDLIPMNTMGELKFKYTVIPTSDATMCGKFGTTDQRYYLGNINASGNFTFATRDNTVTTIGGANTSVHTQIVNNASHQALHDGVVKKTSANFACTDGVVGTDELTLFARRRTGSSKATGRIYYATFTDNDTGDLVGDFRPCYRVSDGVIGFHDLVSDTFYTNSGSGTLTKGADI